MLDVLIYIHTHELFKKENEIYPNKCNGETQSS